MSTSGEPASPTPFETNEVPERSLRLYARLWQLETWLRRMVYIELRALLGDGWNASFKTGKPFDADKRLRHMPTPEMNALSYSQLGDLLGLIEAHWPCFESYFPPQEIWKAKLQEIAQIRHRVAHFRVGHADDYPRLLQFLRDVDPGFWRFCTSYNHRRPVLPQSADLVTEHFLPLDPLPWGEIDTNQWARVGFVDKSKVVAMSVDVTSRPWAPSRLSPEGEPGHFYDVMLMAQDRRAFDLPSLLDSTRHLHSHVAHLMLDSVAGSVRLTLPSVLGAPKIVEILAGFYERAKSAAGRSINPLARDVDAFAAEWPEYVLGPNDPLSFLDPDMPCTFFGA